MVIAGVMVQARPERAAAVGEALAALDGVEVHGAGPDGKLVVTVQTEDAGEAPRVFERIGATDGVVSAYLVYEESD